MANQKLQITVLDKKQINTKFGEKDQWVVNGKWTSFIGNWNKGWVVGGFAEGVFKDTGKYFNIECPPELKQQGPGGGVGVGADPLIMKAILNELIKIHTLLQANAGGLSYTPEGSQPAPSTVNEAEQTTPVATEPAPVNPDDKSGVPGATSEPKPVATGTPVPATEPEVNVEDIPF